MRIPGMRPPASDDGVVRDDPIGEIDRYAIVT